MEQVWNHPGRINPLVESILQFGQRACGLLGEFESLTSFLGRVLDIAEHTVHPLKARQIWVLTLVDDHPAIAARQGERSEGA